jgi:eukaryotic-like serine/threonine-protein kinase
VGSPRGAAEIFADAIELPDGERRAFLDRECRDDLALRADVESLLAHHGPGRGLFASNTILAQLAATLGDAPDALIGRQVGAYRLRSAIASGGMGVVYLGERTDDAFHKDVAVKLLRPGVAGPDLLARFRTERQVLADLEHPGIARLIDGGSTADGIPFLVMEYVDGIPIDRYCDERRLDIDERLALFLEVCAAVSYAHKNLVIHRDLKPSNILVDGAGRPRLLDFGIAKVLEDAPGAERGETMATTLRALTPRYASPEQVRGARITTATDIYSLGVVLYELLTGALPYSLDDRSPAEVERIICEEHVTRPSRAVTSTSAAAGSADPKTAKLAQRLAGDLDTILLKALSKEPERRYATVEEFAADIRRHLEELPVHARPDTASYRLSKFVRRNRALAASVAAIVLILAAALAVTLRQYRLASTRAREAQSLAYVNSLGAAESSILLNKIGEAARYLDAAPEALRDWEWRHLRARIDRSQRAWPGHSASITRVAACDDGARFVSGATDSSVKLWDARTGECLRAWAPLASAVESAAIDSAGRVVVAGLNNGDVLLLSTGTDSVVTVLHRGGRFALVAASRDGSRVAAGLFDGSVFEWDARTGEPVDRWQAHNALAVVAYSPRGRYLISGGDDGLVRVWDTRSHALVREIRAHPNRVYALAVSEDERRFATGSLDRTASVWDLATGERISTFREHRATPASVAFHPRDALVVSAGADGQLLVWNAETATRVGELRGSQDDVFAVASMPGGSAIVSGDRRGTLRLWSWSTEDVRTLALPNRNLVPQIRHIAIDREGARLACASNDVSRLWELNATESTALLRPWAIRRVALTNDGRGLITASDSGIVQIWDVTSPAIDQAASRSVRAHYEGVLGLSLHPDGAPLATSSSDSSIKFWSIPGLEAVQVIRTDGGPILDIEYSPRGDVVASGSADGEIRIWEPRTGALERTLRGHTAGVIDLCWSRDGRWLASTSEDGSLRLWDARLGKERAVLGRGLATMNAVAFSSDGSRLAAGGDDDIVHLFDVETGTDLVSLHGHLGRITALVFSPGDEYLASASNDGTIRIWDAPRARLDQVRPAR